MLNLALLAACTQGPSHPRAALSRGALPTGSTADTAEVPPEQVTAVLVGQSNACGFDAIPPDFHSLLPGGDHEGARLVRNGTDRANYAGTVAPDAFLIDELILSGYAPEQVALVAWCAQATYLDRTRDTLIPNVEADITARGLPPPSFVALWQGEAEARAGRDRALTYADDLLGTEGGYSFLDAVWERWPGARISVIELAVRADSYADPEGEALVRSAHQLAGAYPGVCSIPTYGATFLPGSSSAPDDNPHVDMQSREAIARRAARAWATGVCP